MKELEEYIAGYKESSNETARMFAEEIAALRKQVERYERPISDEEALKQFCHCKPPSLAQMNVIRGYRNFATKVLASRKHAAQKESTATVFEEPAAGPD